VSANGIHSGGTAIWQAPLESFTTFHPEGTVCVQAGGSNKKNRVRTMFFLMVGV